MFGLNDNNQNDNSQTPMAHHDDTLVPPLPVENHFPEPTAMPEPPAVPEPPALPEPPAAGPGTPTLDQHDHPGPASEDMLIGLKEQALSNLSPLIGHLEQTPEEKFKTLMMLIQASDNSSLIKEAYEAAGQIQDEKARAQALLDVVNEINYFTQKDQPEG
jgi:hypothetical protein